ncbi:hypothetical protein BDQ12DRAFT_643120 [Crucibulum laeve]|uniref:Uncharacterized protein n=1 Tax=Crucibulum laeve TaxID=68775 RepID=A0A5C3MDM8_9AGAR|nr:hypothetical protein BDQ12DRAFT_643120 [Crucibulum laeve]
MSSSNSASSDLAAALSDGACLLDSKHTTGNAVPASDLKSVLETRLSQYFQRIGKDERLDETASLEDVQLRTADETLSVVERVQRIIGGNHPGNIPAIGTRDLAQLRMLISIVFKWGIDPLLTRVVQAWPSKPSTVGPSRIIDLTTTPDDYRLLSSLLFRVLFLLFPTGVHAQLPQTLITTTLLNRHIIDILRPCIALGWLPKLLSSNSMPTVHDLRPLSMRLLSILPPSQTIATLGTVLSSTPKLPIHVQKTCASLLSRQLLRSNGVPGLFEAIFGEEETGDIDVPVEKLEHVSRVLSTVPSNTKPQEYFHIIIPRIISILLEDAPAAYKRAAAFSISQLLADEVLSPHKELASAITLSIIHKPFLELPSDESNQTDSNSASPNHNLQPSNALSVLISLISNSDPSPVFISNLLSPIIPILYSLLYHLEKHKASDPTLKVSLHGILVTWGKIVTQAKGIEVLSSILDNGEGSEWRVDLGGNFARSQKSGPPSGLDLLTPDNFNRDEEPDVDTNLFDLYPDPSHFVQFLKTIERSDISSEIFVKLLEAYHTQKSDANSDPMQRIIRYLQVIMQMQKQMTEGTTSNILRTPAHILTFIKHVLESAQSQDSSGVKSARSTAPKIKDEPLENSDSDDDMEDSEIIRPDDEMVETAINLLLSILEVDEDLSARTMPILNDIFSLLEPIVRGRSSSLRPVAREARMVMTARLAATKGTRKANVTEENAQEIYQKALKLLQDPILPVRAHGLLLLRQLVTPSRDSKNTQAVDSAFVPAILSIFLQFLQDDDSYMFLNAVQGLAAMVDRFGKEVLRRLVNEYASGLQGIAASNLTQQDIDIRTRIGEALGTVIKRCGTALGIYADMLVPPLFNILRSREIPTTLRTSSLSLLADCIKTYPVAILPYLEDLASSMIDLIQIESVQTLTESARADDTKREDGDLDESSPTMDSHPTSLNSKFPPLRRAALHFLTLLIRETTRDIYDSPSTLSREGILPNNLIKRAKITLGYIAFTDADNVVRVMAREAGEDLAQLQDAITGV